MKVTLLIASLLSLSAFAADPPLPPTAPTTASACATNFPICGKAAPTSNFAVVQCMFRDAFKLDVDISQKSLLEDKHFTGNNRSQIWLVGQKGVAQLRMKSGDGSPYSKQASFCRTNKGVQAKIDDMLFSSTIVISPSKDNRYTVQILEHPEYNNVYDLAPTAVQVGVAGR